MTTRNNAKEDVTDVQQLKKLLQKHGIRPRRHWGQNFLVSEKVLQQMLAAADIQPGDTVLEIGGGAGALTAPLVEHAKQVLVYERDPGLCAILTKHLVSFTNADIRCEDARTIDFNALPHDYRIVSNLPYSVGLPILRTALESTNPPKDAHVMLQREVGERLIQRPPGRTLAGAAMQVLADIEKLFLIPASATWPTPDVDSVYLRLTPRSDTDSKTQKHTIEIMKRGYRHPRKKVLRNLTEKEQTKALSEACAIAEDARAQELTNTQWGCAAAWLGK